MIILLGSQKGGCGKSTLATNISASLALRGFDVCLLDADKQITSGSWASERENQELPHITSIQKYGPLASTLKDLSKRYQYVVVDTAGRDSDELRSAMLVADLVIFPFRPSQADLYTANNVESIAAGAKDLNQKLKVCYILSIAPTQANASEIIDAKDFFASQGAHLLDEVVFDRKAYRDAFREGRGVEEWTDKKAKKEIGNLIQEIIG